MSNPFAVETVRCAGPGCMNVRREANHWFVVKFPESELMKVFSCKPFEVGYKLRKYDHPACGGACAQKLFEQFLSKKDREK